MARPDVPDSVVAVALDSDNTITKTSAILFKATSGKEVRYIEFAIQSALREHVEYHEE